MTIDTAQIKIIMTKFIKNGQLKDIASVLEAHEKNVNLWLKTYMPQIQVNRMETHIKELAAVTVISYAIDIEQEEV